MTNSAPPAAATRLAAPIYLAAALLVLLPAADFVSNVWPLQPGDFRWRFGMAGLLSGFLLTPLLGLVLAAATAAFAGHRRVQRAVGVVNCVGAAVLVVLVVLFALDVLQLRPSIQSDALGSFDFANARSIAKHLLAAATLAWLGVAGLRAAAAAEPAAGRVGEKRSPILAATGAAATRG